MDGGVGHIIATPMSDADIREYLPHAPILKYSELAKYPTLGDLLPEVKSFCILLYEDSPNKGHWVVVSRPVEGVAEYLIPTEEHPTSHSVGLRKTAVYNSGRVVPS